MLHVKLNSVCIIILLGLLGNTVLVANPTGPQIVNGQASFSQPNPHTLNITNSPGAIINWQQFSIQHNEITRFIQQSNASAVMNRVVGQNTSSLLGQLLSNGRVFLINPNGIVFGQNAVIDTAGFIASTLNMTNEDFLNEHLKFQGNSDAGVINNRGYIKAGKNGDIYLIAPNIENSGIIETEGGQLILAAGESVTLASLDSENIVFDVQAPENEIVNLGELLTHGGAAGMFAGTIQHSGTVNADSITVDDQGRVQIFAKADITLNSGSTITANGTRGGEVKIESETGTVWNSGNIEAKGLEGNGGHVEFLGERVALIDEALVDVSGVSGGGKALIGGDYKGENPEIKNAAQTYVGDDTLILADAISNGDGGKVIVWADETTQAYGKISATGGEKSGDGGFVETSGKRYLDVTHAPDITAANGMAGTWLLDPENITISTGSNNNITPSTPFQPVAAGSSVLNTTTLQTALNGGGTIIVDTTGGSAGGTGDLTVSNTVTKNAGADATLDLRAHNNLNINASITSSSNQLNMIFDADQDNLGGGDINLGSVTLDANGGTITATNETVNVNTLATPTINSAFDVGTLNFINRGTLTIEDTVTVNNTLNWNLSQTTSAISRTIQSLLGGGTLDIPGLFRITGNVDTCPGAFCSDNFDRFLSGITVNILNGGILEYSTGFQDNLNLQNSAVINVQSGGLFDIQIDEAIIGSSGGGSIKLQAGSELQKSVTTGQIEIQVGLDVTDATIDIQAGEIELIAGSMFTGTQTLTGAGSPLRFGGGTHTIADNSDFDGDIRVEGATLNFEGQFEVDTLNLRSGTLGLDTLDAGDTFTVNNTLTWIQVSGPSSRIQSTGGNAVLDIPGQITVTGNRDTCPAAFCSDDFDRFLDGVEVNILNGGILEYSTGFQDNLNLQNSAVINVQSGGLLDIQTDEAIIGSSGGGNIKLQAGSELQKSVTTGQTEIQVGLDVTDATIDIQAGEIELIAGSMFTGTQTLTGAGSPLRFGGGTHTIADNSDFDGDIRVEGATLNFEGQFEVDTLNLRLGTLGLDTLDAGDSFTVNNTLTWTLSQSGTTSIQSTGGNAVLDIPGQLTVTGNVDTCPAAFCSDDFDRFLDGVEVNILNGGILEYSTGFQDNLNLQNSAVINVQSGGLLDIQTDEAIVGSSGGGSIKLLAGSELQKSVTTGQTEIQVGLDVTDATIDVQTGEIELIAGSMFTGTQTLTGAGSPLRFGGGTHTIADNSDFDGDIRVEGATLNFEGQFEVDTLNLRLGTLGLDTLDAGDTFTVNNTLTWTLSQSGTTSIQSTGGNAVLDIPGQLTVTGNIDTCPAAFCSDDFDRFLDGVTVNILNGGILEYSTGNLDNLNLQNGAVINIQSGGLFDIQNTENIVGTGAINNGGTIIKSSSGTSTINNTISYTNTGGTIDIQTGTLSLGGNTLTIDTDGTLMGNGTFSGSVNNSGTIKAGTSPGTITISGNLVLDADSILDIELGDDTIAPPFVAGSDYDLIVVTGSANLDGTMNITEVDGFTATIGDMFDVMTFASSGGPGIQTINAPFGDFYNASIVGSDTIFRLTMTDNNNIFIWNGLGDGSSWGDPDNWDPPGAPTSGVPTTSDDALIDPAGSVTVVANSFGLGARQLQMPGITGGTADNLSITNFGSLTLDGTTLISGNLLFPDTFATLQGAGDITVSGLITLTGGQILGPGKLFADGGIVFTGSNNKLLSRDTDHNAPGTVVWDTTTNVGGTATTFNHLSGTIDVQSDSFTLSGKTFNNQATVIRTAGTGDLGFTGPFNNDGSFIISSGGMRIAGPGIGTSTGNFTSNANTSIEFSKSGFEFNGGTFSGAGTFEFIGDANFNSGVSFNPDSVIFIGSGTINLDTGNPVNIANSLLLSRGTLQGSDDIIVDGLTTITNTFDTTTLGGTGNFTANGGLVFTGTSGSINLNRNVDHTAPGTVIWDIDSFGVGGSGTFNHLSGTIDIQGDIRSFNPVFNNLDTVLKTVSSNTLEFRNGFNNNGGVLTLSSGGIGLLFSAGGSSSSGTITINSGTTFDSNENFDITGGSISGDGSISFNSRTVNIDPGVIYNVANTTIDFATVNFDNLATTDVFNQTGSGILDGLGSLTVNNSWVPTTSFIFGTMILGNGINETLSSITIQDRGTIINQGTLTLDNVTFQGAGTGTFNNQGTLTLDNVTFNSADLVNDGILNPGASPGTVNINGNYTQTGILNVELGGINPGDFDLLNITGTATLGGTLNINMCNTTLCPIQGDFAGLVNDTFNILTYGSVLGDFASVNPPAGYSFLNTPFGGVYQLQILGLPASGGSNPPGGSSEPSNQVNTLNDNNQGNIDVLSELVTTDEEQEEEQDLVCR